MTYPQQYPPQFPQPQAPAQSPGQPYNPAVGPAPQYPQPAPPQQFPGVYGAPPAYGGFQPPQQYPPQPPMQLQNGTLSDYFNQPSTDGGPGLTWRDKVTKADKPIGSRYIVQIIRDVKDSDVRQQTTMATPQTPAQPKAYRDGRPMLEMAVPCRLLEAIPHEFPDGTATWYVKGQGRDELVRAMTEAGAPKPGEPQGGDMAVITLTERKPSRGGGVPANIVAVQYQCANPNLVTVAPSPAPVAQPAPQAPQYPPATAAVQSPPGAPTAPLDPAVQAALEAARAQVAAQQQAAAPAPETPAGPPVTPPADGHIAPPAGLSDEAMRVFDKLAAGRTANPAS